MEGVVWKGKVREGGRECPDMEGVVWRVEVGRER